MKIGIPVKCQNGHKATWLIEISGLDAVSMGTFGDPRRCNCPKHQIGQGYFADGDPFLFDQSNAARDVLAERLRQVDGEEFDASHDDMAARGQIAKAAACYALQAGGVGTDYPDGIRNGSALFWPWAAEWWKPSDARRNLVKAGALILAEIERIDRQAAKAVQS